MENKEDEITKSNDLQLTKKKKKKVKHPPARVQKEPGSVDDQLPQTGTVFNIWYLKWSGGDKEDGLYNQRKAESRCVITTDAGYTKADKTPGAYFCLYFARGMCSRGKNCDYLHRLPTEDDMFKQNVDCFGRDKFADYRDDMGGVGSFLRQSRTIYVGRINATDDAEEVVSRHFQEWGKIERIRVLNSRGVAFVTYSNEANSQFAKEAMAHQSLDNNEILNVRWATDDPNPLARAREKRRLEEQAATAIRKLLPKEYGGEADQDARQKKRLKSSYDLEGYTAPEELNIPTGDLPEDIVNPETIAESNLENDTKQPGLFSSTALKDLQTVLRPEPPSVSSSASLVADYDSDDE